jgi:dipeptidase E
MSKAIATIFLAGGGSAEDSRLLDENFVKTLALPKPLVYIPNAMRSRSYESCLEWFRSVMEPLGVTAIEMWDDLHPHLPATEIAGIYIGGGDTTKLLTELRQSGFDNYLREVAENGTPIYGGSAGAIVLGEDIRTAIEARGLSAFQAVGLKLVSGCSIVCHYEPGKELATLDLAQMLDQPMIAIPEKAGARISRGVLTNYGTEPLVVIRANRMDSINPGETTALNHETSHKIE